jgi:predicted TIM-barrel fold metal-dependent hydrolase
MIFDAHLHIIAPGFELIPNQGYVPPWFTTADYLPIAGTLGITGGAVVSGSFQGYDQTYLREALSRLGPTFVGVTQLPRTVSDETILDLARCGVRAIRFNLRRGGSESVDAIEEMAWRVFDLARWHIEIYADAQELAPMVPLLNSLPRIVIDHLGLSAPGLPTVLKLVEHGAKVKATGFGRVTLDGVTLDVAAAIKAIVAVNPEALMFGTDLPSTRANRPFAPSDIELIRNELGPGLARRVLYDNAIALYRPGKQATTGGV